MLYLSEITFDSKPSTPFQPKRTTMYALAWGFGKAHAYARTKRYYDKTFGQTNTFVCINVRGVI